MQGGGAMDINDQATKDGILESASFSLQKVRDGVTSLEKSTALPSINRYRRMIYGDIGNRR